MTSRCRQNFSESCENAINAQINMELAASYVYQSMAAHFSHDSVALPGLASRFRKEAEEERSHALKFVDYLTKRGGFVKFTDISAPKNSWKSARDALEAALSLEKDVNASLLKLHELADEASDPHLADFIEEEFLDDQVESLKELADLITQLDRCGNEGLGLYLFDQKLSKFTYRDTPALFVCPRQMKSDDLQKEKELFTLVPSQISPNPLRRRGAGASPDYPLLSETSSQNNNTSSSTVSSLLCDEPVLNFENLLQKRHGSVLGHDIILKSEHFFKGMNKTEGELKLFGAPNFRSTNLNIYGAAQPSSSGLATILRVLGCAPCDHLSTAPASNLLTIPGSTTSNSSEALTDQRKRTIWFSTREEPIIYVNDTPFVVRDMASPFVNIKSYTGISSNRLESVENRLKADILAEAKHNHGLLLVHDEQDNHDMIPCLISVDSVKTPKEVMQDIRSKGFAVDYYRIPVSHEQSPTDPYIDEYFKVFSATPTDWPVVFSCGMGIGRTTYGMVIGLLIRRAQLIKNTTADPFNLKIPQLPQDFGFKSRTTLRLVYILEQGLQSKQSAQSAIEWILDRSDSIDKLEAGINGNYMVINDLVRVLPNGAFCKQVVDSAIDRCDTVVNLREHILLYRVRSVIQNGPNSSLDTGLGFLERYFSLISFCQYVEEQLIENKNQAATIESFQDWMKTHKEIWKMLTYLRSSNNKLKAFRPLEELRLNDADEVENKQKITAFRSPQMRALVSEDIAVVQGRMGTVLGPNTILKIDHWTSIESTSEVAVLGAPNFRRIETSACAPHQIYAVAQPTQAALEKILELVSSSLPTPRRIVWINVREEPLLYINGEPYVLRDQYASLRNIKAYTGIAANRLEQMEMRLKEDVLAESRAHLGRILLHSEGSERDLLPIWETVQNVSTMQDFFSLNSALIQKYPHLEYYRVPITAEEAPEPADFDTLLKILSDNDESENFTFTHGAVFIFNCQMGLGRSTMGSVIGMEILSSAMPETVPSPVTVHYKVITNLIRMLKAGNEAKKLADVFIDQVGGLINLRQSIEDYRKAASRCTDDRKHCRKLVNKGIQALKRYALLILFQAYLIEKSPETFEAWILRHQEFGNLFHELENKEIQGLTVLSEIEKPEEVVANLSLAGDHHKTLAKQKEVKEVVAGRLGAVLAPMTILKFDHFIGCQKQSLPERIEGAPNFRQVPLGDAAERYVCGLAMPTKSAIERVLNRIDCVPSGKRRCLWISMREEPVIFVNGQPFVLRIVKDPIANLEMTGIISERVELMEIRLKAEAEAEASRYSNRLLLHEEELVPGNPPKLEIVPEWEDICDPDAVESPAEVYQAVIKTGGYPLTYVRVPVTDEQAPIPYVFDELVQLISAEKYTDFIFNCQMGRGRTTTGMVITMLYHKVLSSPANMKYLKGDYKLIQQLCQLLEKGQKAKRLADFCIDSCAHLQNLREAIYDHKVRLTSSAPLTPDQVHEIESRGLHYLLRYFYLIVFAEYLLEELKKETGKFGKTFLDWLAERREITNLTQMKISFD